MSWANTWRRWFRQWFPEPPEELVRLRAKARKLAGENRRLRSECDRARSEAGRDAAQAEEMERRLAVVSQSVKQQESDIALLERERDKLLLILKRQDAREEHEAGIKLIDLEAAKRRLQGPQD